MRTTSRSRTLWIIIFAIMLATACQTYTDTLTGGKTAADETKITTALRAIASAQAMYAVAHEGNYGTFEQLVSNNNLDTRFSGERPVIGGYVLTMKITPPVSGAQPASFAVNADPQPTAGAASARHFYLDSTGNAVHVNETQPATASDKPLP
ncbi:MAG: hypothetical protein H7Y30_12385 [Pyrinomonadaceae bacterium]|nr:hypothetical protein [Pyrinomonadaceae bacterium]